MAFDRSSEASDKQEMPVDNLSKGFDKLEMVIDKLEMVTDKLEMVIAEQEMAADTLSNGIDKEEIASGKKKIACPPRVSVHHWLFLTLSFLCTANLQQWGLSAGGAALHSSSFFLITGVFSYFNSAQHIVYCTYIKPPFLPRLCNTTQFFTIKTTINFQ